MIAREKEATIRRLMRRSKYELSIHAERERQADKITIAELEEALRNCELMEDYPDDPRGDSCLAVGFAANRPIHAVWALKHSPEEIFLITVYDPSQRPEKWADNYRRRRGK